MATLSSSSTLAEIQAAYDDNASYAEDASTVKAVAFITACRLLLRRTYKRQVHGGRGGQELEADPSLLRAELEDARRWLAARVNRAAGPHYLGTAHDFRE